MRLALFFGYSIIIVAIVIGIWFVINFPIAHGQNVTPPAVPPTAPTVTNVPTPTTPNPNWQFLPQKAYVQPFAPEVGIPNNAIPLTAVPQVVSAPTAQTVQQQQQQPTSIVDSLGGWTGIAALAGAAGLYLKQRVMGKTVQENSAMIIKGADVDQSIAKQVYENMPDKGESINDKPEIRLENLNKNKEEATETASKA